MPRPSTWARRDKDKGLDIDFYQVTPYVDVLAIKLGRAPDLRQPVGLKT